MFLFWLVVVGIYLLAEAVHNGTSLGRSNGKNKFKETDNIKFNDWKE